jgi:hypothetical protein
MAFTNTYALGLRLVDGADMNLIGNSLNGLGNQAITLASPVINGTVTGTGTTSLTLTGVGATVGGVATGSFSLASSTTLTNVVGLAANVTAGGVYQIDIYMAVTNNSTGGINLKIGGTATATQVLADTQVFNTTTLSAENNITALSSSLVNAAVAATLVFITGSITVNAAGTLQIQAAQNTSNATALTIANGSYISLTRLA